MANPTLNRPTRPVFSASLGFGATCKSFVDCAPTNGVPIELVRNMPGRPWEGELGYGVGCVPRSDATGFDRTPDGGSPCLRFLDGSPEMFFGGCGFATGDGNQRTMAIVCRIDFAHPPGDLTNYGLNLIRCKVRTTSNSINAMSVRTSKDGPTIEAVTSSGGSLTMDGINRVNGRWYAFALSTDQTASPFTYRLQIYDFTTQTLGTLYDRTSTSTWPLVASTDLAIGGYSATDVFAGPFKGAVACAILDKQLWDATKFQSFYEDPWATVRGTYSAAGTFTAPSNGWFTSGENGCRIAVAPPTGTGVGGTGSPTVHLHRFTDLSASPSVGTRVLSNITADAGGAIFNPTDTTAPAQTVLGYRYEFVDGSSTLWFPPTNQTPILAWRRASGDPIFLNLWGDSRTANKTPACSPLPAILSKRLDRPVCFVNRGLSGTYANQWTVGVNGRSTLTITGSPSSGTTNLQVVLGTTGVSTTFRNIPYNCTAELLETILEDNTGLYTNSVLNGSNTAGIGGPGNVTCTGGPLPTTPIVINFDGPTSSKKAQTITIQTNALNNSAVPTIAANWVGAEPYANCYTAAMSYLLAALAADPDLVPWVHVAVGTNDMNGTLQQVIDYQRYLQANIAVFAENGIKCVYSPPPMLRPGATNFNTAANMEIGRQYPGALAAIADGVTCIYGGPGMDAFSVLEPLGSADGLHGFANGAESADERIFWADGIYAAINPSSGGSSNYPAPFIEG